MVKCNITIELESERETVQFKNWVENYAKVVDFRILPDTETLYENDPKFREHVKNEKKMKTIKNKYINDNN